MRCYIKRIFIYDKDGNEKSKLELKQGVNIFTGDSKTGKSAIVEIIDYCLCSTQCTIPKGIITENGFLYVIIIETEDKSIILGRYSKKESGKMFLIQEKKFFDLEAINYDYLKASRKRNVSDVKIELENLIGLKVSNYLSDDKEKTEKATMRNMVSFMFQHQNLIANKFALFYRFEIYSKRKGAIEQFPIFSGIIDQNYYILFSKLKSRNDELKKMIKEKNINEFTIKKINNELKEMIKEYFALIGQRVEETSDIEKIKKIANNLPAIDYSNFFISTEPYEIYINLKKKIENLETERGNLILKKAEYRDINDDGQNHFDILHELNKRQRKPQEGEREYLCPMCGGSCEELKKKIFLEEQESSEWLEQELKSTEKYRNSFSQEIYKIEEKIKELTIEINKNLKNKRIMEKKYFSNDELKNQDEKVGYSKARIKFYIENLDNGIFENIDGSITKLKLEIEKIEEEIAAFKLKEKMEEFNYFLTKNMKVIAKKLDFEEEYRPVELHLSEDFDLYNLVNNQRIYLSEMGSGANWISCHLALFLSFLRYFTQKKESLIPTILFFDQPSQVYFPQEKEKCSDKKAINKLFKTIFDEVESISNDIGYLPQVIIAEHVTEDIFLDEDLKLLYKNSIVEDWHNGAKLITNK